MTAKTQNDSLMAYERALEAFSAALTKMRAGDAETAATEFRRIADENPTERVLVDRCRTYERICGQKLAGEPEAPSTPDALYHAAVVAINAGQSDRAIPMLDRALQDEPNSARLLYARASAWALEGRADASISDLRQAIAADPTVRFQATNDPDFERIREEPSFIDIIEPTPTGV